MIISQSFNILRKVVRNLYAWYISSFLNFDKLAVGQCKLFLFLILYLWFSLFASNRCLLLIMCKTNEYMYWEYNVIIYIFLKTSLQESLGLVLVIILIIFFWSINTLLAYWSNFEWELPFGTRYWRTGRRGRRCKQLQDDLKENRTYPNFNEEALYRTLWRSCYGGGYGTVFRKTEEFQACLS